jgi:hypothetical protein
MKECQIAGWVGHLSSKLIFSHPRLEMSADGTVTKRNDTLADNYNLKNTEIN